jgi:NADH-quinone oxidoreductase subunit A
MYICYYLVAILFILFDLEVAFVFPWAVVQCQLGWFGFVAISIFLLLLVVRWFDLIEVTIWAGLT